MKNKKNFKPAAIILVISMLLTACAGGSTAAPATGESKITTTNGFECPAPEFPVEVTSTELNIFVWTEYISQDMRECFELVYNIKVNQREYSSTDEMLASLAEGGQNYDLVQPTDYAVSSMVRDGFLQELDHGKLPILKNFDLNYLDFEFDPGNRYTIPYLAGTDAIVVNTSAVTNVPRSWADLWNPEYANRLLFLDDSRSVIAVALLSLGYDANTTDLAQLAEAEQHLRQLIPSIRIFDSDSPSSMLIQKQADLGMTWTGEAVIAKQANPAIQYIFPTEGAILWQDNWAMLANAPHVDAAYAWLNYTMQGNVFWVIIRDWPYTNPNTAALEFAKDNPMKVLDLDGNETTLAAIYKDYISSPIINVPAAVLQNGHRIADVGEAAALYEDIWKNVRGE